MMMNGRPLGVAPISKMFTMFGCPDSSAHGTLLAHEPLEVFLVEVGGQHLDGDGAIERGLRTAVDHAEAAAADLLCLREADGRELPGDIVNDVMLSYERIAFGHQAALDRKCRRGFRFTHNISLFIHSLAESNFPPG